MNSKEQLQPPSEVFIGPLLELRDYYAGLAEEYQRLFLEARSQLHHTEALLSNWSFTDDNNRLSQLGAANGTLATTQENSLLLLSSEPTPETSTSETLLAPIESQLPDSNQLEVDRTNSRDVGLIESNTENTSLDSYGDSIKGVDIPMLPEHQNLTRMEALKKLLQEYAGTVCHIDFVVRSLYGDLEPSIFKVVKGRVQSSLTQGRERGYWAAIPNEPGCYTLNLSLLGPTSGNGFAQSFRFKRKKPFILPKTKIVPMLKTFDGQFLIDAITSFLEQNMGRIFGVNEIVHGIYGDLDSQQLREVKNKVLNELSRGHRTGRFSRVPHKIGYYTWDVGML
jgi:hypothetical protein